MSAKIKKWRNKTEEEIVAGYEEYTRDLKESYDRYQAAFDTAIKRAGYNDEAAARAAWTKVADSLGSRTRSKESLRSSGKKTPTRQEPDSRTIGLEKPSPASGSTITRPRSLSTETSAITDTSTQSISRPSIPKTGKAISEGAKARVFTERGREVETRYKVVESGELVTSHDDAGQARADYPQEVQPRDRSRVASEAQIGQIARNLNPEFLGESPKAGEGAPIVGSDNVVESGNGRALAIARAYKEGGDRSQAYKQYLLDNAERFGLDRAAIEKAKNPVLVRERLTELDRAEFAREANESSVAEMSPVERARQDAGRLTPGLMERFAPNDAGEINTSANRDFIGKFLDEIVGPAERGRYQTADGSISQEGLTRIRNAVFAKAYGDSPEGLAAIEKLAESPDSNVKNITTALLHKAGEFAALKDAIGKGARFDLDITGDLSAAMKKLSQLREEGMSVSDYLAQGKLFGEELTGLQREILSTFDSNKRSAKAIDTILDNYLGAVEQAGDPRQATMFGRMTPDKEVAFKAAIEKGAQHAKEARIREAAANRKGKEAAARDLQTTDRPPSPEATGDRESPARVEEPPIVTEARKRLRDAIQGKKLSANPLDTLVDTAIVTGYDIYKTTKDFAQWSKQMVKRVGEKVRPHLRNIYSSLQKSLDGMTREKPLPKGFKESERGFLRFGGKPDLLTLARFHTAEGGRKGYNKFKLDAAKHGYNVKSKEFGDAWDKAQDMPPVRGVGELAKEAINLPRAVQSSMDLSAPLRQGAILSAAHPILGIKAGWQMIRSLKKSNHEQILRDMENHPAIDRARQSDLYLAKDAEHLGDREEAFMSRLAGRLTAPSERAYTTFLDKLRLDVFDNYVKRLEKAEGVTAQDFKDAAKFINHASGRGDIPEFAKGAAPFLNGLLFSPRYLASRFQVLNPVRYAKMSPAARKLAVQDMVKYFGVVGMTLTLAKLGGAEVELDPDKADFLKIKIGNTRYDTLAGMQQVMRFAYRVPKAFGKAALGKDIKKGHHADEIALQFLRSKLAPVPSYIVNTAKRENPVGEKFHPVWNAHQHVLPLFVKDLYEAYQKEGLTGAAKTSPGMFGVGVQTYKKKSKPMSLRELGIEF